LPILSTDGQFLPTLDYAPLGAQIGEGCAIAAQIRAGDAASWYNAWSSYADRLYDLAVKSQAAGQRVSARNAFLRASNYYRAAYIFMFALPIDPRVIEAYQTQTDSFRRSRAHWRKMMLQCSNHSSTKPQATTMQRFILGRGRWVHGGGHTLGIF
jgi:hypothetical protein